MNQHHNGTDLQVTSIRRRLDKGEQIKGNDVRYVLAVIDSLNSKIDAQKAEIETIPDAKPVRVNTDTGEILEGTAKPSGNPDPIDDKAWDKWLDLCKRADALQVPHPNPNRETTLKAELRTAYMDLDAFVRDAAEQAATVE